MDITTISCPSCDNENLHQGRVEIFQRVEDAPHGLHISAENETATIDSGMKNNPSSRRSGMNVHLSCEHCDHKSVLIIYQHKGMTYIELQ